MKKRRIVACLFLCFCLFSCVSSPPQWYADGVFDAGPGCYAGMGEGKTREEARDRALADIAGQIEVRIRAETLIDEQEGGGESSLFYGRGIETVTDIVLTGAERMNEEKRGGVYYALYRYDNRPLRVRLAEAAGGEQNAYESEAGAIFSRNLPFARFLRKNGMSGDFLLYYGNRVWNVSVGGNIFPVSDRELAENFFPDGGEGEIELIQGHLKGSAVIGQAPDRLKSGQSFSLKITPPVSGYMNLFYTDNAGVTLSLLTNEDVTEGESFIYPDPQKHPGGLVAETPERFAWSTDMVLAVFTPEPLDGAANLQQVSESGVSGENEGLYAYGRLLEILNEEQNGMTWCSRVIHVED